MGKVGAGEEIGFWGGGPGSSRVVRVADLGPSLHVLLLHEGNLGLHLPLKLDILRGEQGKAHVDELGTVSTRGGAGAGAGFGAVMGDKVWRGISIQR